MEVYKYSYIIYMYIMVLTYCANIIGDWPAAVDYTPRSVAGCIYRA
jgi:hypothetical protein